MHLFDSIWVQIVAVTLGFFWGLLVIFIITKALIVIYEFLSWLSKKLG